MLLWFVLLVHSASVWAQNAPSGQNKKSETTDARDYHHELMSHVNMTYLDGALGSADGTEVSKNKRLAYDVSMTYGYLAGDMFEPVLEVEYGNQTFNVGEFKGTQKNLGIGFGLLFNFPLFKNFEWRGDATNSPEISSARFIPFGGFIMGLESNSQMLEGDSKLSTEFSDTVLKVVAGTRWVMFHHLALNSVFKLTYENSHVVAESTVKSGGSRKRLHIQGRILGLSLFF